MTYPFENFYELVEKNAKNSPRKTAIFIDKYKANYKTLKERIDTFARFLESNSISHGDKVAIIIGNSEEFIISFFATTKIGAIAIPINTFLKEEEFAYILNDAQAKMLICSSDYKKQAKNLNNLTPIDKTIWTHGYKEEDEHNIDYNKIISNITTHEQVSHKPKLDDLACIFYTSGTTGQPKGAMLTYKNLFSNVCLGTDVYKISPKDRFMVYLPMFHSFTLTITILLPFYTCSSMVIAKSVFPFSNILKQVLLKRVTLFPGVPTVYNAINKAKIPWYFLWFNKIRIFLSGSAPLSEKTLNDFSKKFKRAYISEGYGLSECSPAVSINRLDNRKPLSVGHPLPGYEVKIVDDEMVELPVGEVGEVIVKGDCVMQGYLGHTHATDETIINGWLRTGDLGKLDDEGFLFIVDRKKDLIISKGINIYPRQIEEVLSKYEGIDSAAVVGMRDENGDEDVIAFLQLKDDVALIPENEIKKYLKKHLANYKIPKHIYTVEELPKNATGKVLKRVLKEELKKGHFATK